MSDGDRHELSVIDDMGLGDLYLLLEERVAGPTDLHDAVVLGVNLLEIRLVLSEGFVWAHGREVALLVAEGVDGGPESWSESGLIHCELIHVDGSGTSLELEARVAGDQRLLHARQPLLRACGGAVLLEPASDIALELQRALEPRPALRHSHHS